MPSFFGYIVTCHRCEAQIARSSVEDKNPTAPAFIKKHVLEMFEKAGGKFVGPNKIAICAKCAASEDDAKVLTVDFNPRPACKMTGFPSSPPAS